MSTKEFIIKSSIFKINIFYLKNNFKLLLFFIFFWFIISLIFLFLSTVGPAGGKVFISRYVINNHGSSFSISDILNEILFSFPAIIYYSIVIMFFINKLLLSEISNSKLAIWLSLPLSRKEIVNSKNIFIGITIFSIFIPSYLLIILFSATAYDAKQNIGYVFLYGIQFILFIIVLWFFYLLISLVIPWTILTNIIIGLILFWISVIDITYLTLMYLSLNLEFMKYIKYISPELLLISPFQYSEQVIFNSSNTIGLYVKNTNFIFLLIMTILMPILSYLIFILNHYKFKNKDLNI